MWRHIIAQTVLNQEEILEEGRKLKKANFTIFDRLTKGKVFPLWGETYKF